MSRRFQLGIFVVILLLMPWLAGATEPGWLGMSVKASIQGENDPVLKTITIIEIEAGSPAAVANLAVGDSIIEIENVPVSGCKASEAKQLMTKAPGEKLTLRLRRTDGTTYMTVLVAGTNPT
ncbi:MAG TPA: PDZ domain-containing protein [Chthoniobacterales bacterium]